MTNRRRLLSHFVVALPDSVFIWLVARLHRRVEPEMKFITKNCDPDGIAIDVGAWYGPWSYWLSRRVKHVETFEPNPAVTAKMSGHLGANVQIHPKALSDANGTQRLFLSGGGEGLEGQSSLLTEDPSTPSIDVELITIDGLGLRDIRLVKIDVEGFEYRVLKGGEATITRDHPVLVVELEVQFGDIYPSLDLVTNWGYKGKYFCGNRWVDFGLEQFVNDQKNFLAERNFRGYLSAAVKKGYGYYNNVVFIHPESTWIPW